MPRGKRYAKKRVRAFIRKKLVKRDGQYALYPSVGFRYRNPTHYFKRSLELSNVQKGNISNTVSITLSNNPGYMKIALAAAAGLSQASFAFAFQFSDLPTVTDFSDLFDRYIIKGVKIKIMPMGVGQQTYNSSPPAVTLHDVVDYDDATQPAAATAVSVLNQYESYKCRNLTVGGKPIVRYIRPRIATGAYGGAVFTNYANSRAQWIDMASTSVEHYGWKGCIEASNDTAQAVDVYIKVMLTYYFACKDVR